MSSMIAFSRETLLAALEQHPTVNVRESLAASLGRLPSKGEIDAGRRAARTIAQDGTAVLITLYRDQAKGVECQMKGSHAVLHLTVDEEVVLDLPYRVEVATGRWVEVVEEGKKRTDEMIENDPILSWMMGRGPRPAALGGFLRRVGEHSPRSEQVGSGG